jgi:hypothetical protein
MGSLENLLIEKGVFSGPCNKKEQYKPTMIVFNAMEQIWLDNFYFPMRERLLPALCNELETNFNLSTRCRSF